MTSGRKPGSTPAVAADVRAKILAALVGGALQAHVAKQSGRGPRYVGAIATEARAAGVLIPYRKAAPRTAQAAALRAQGFDIGEIAKRLGVTYNTIHKLLARLDARAGEDEPEADATPGCVRCGLRSTFDKVPHECLPTSIEAYMGRRGEMDCHRNRTS